MRIKKRKKNLDLPHLTEDCFSSLLSVQVNLYLHYKEFHSQNSSVYGDSGKGLTDSEWHIQASKRETKGERVVDVLSRHSPFDGTFPVAVLGNCILGLPGRCVLSVHWNPPTRCTHMRPGSRDGEYKALSLMMMCTNTEI